MGTVIKWPGHAHARVPDALRAASSTSLPGVTPADLARLVDTIEYQASDGMLLRCLHLATAETLTCTSDAIASGEGQSSTTSRKELMLIMLQSLGQIVLTRKDILALDRKKSLGHNVRMPTDDSEDHYKRDFIDRVKSTRIATGKKQWEVAELLNVPQDHYKHWERSRLMPHHLVGRFCLITHVDPNWLMTGKGTKPLRPITAVEAEPERPILLKPKKPKQSKIA